MKNGFIPQLKLIDGVDNIALKVGAAGWAIFQYSASIQTLLEKNVTISNDLLAGAISLPLFQIVSWKTALPIIGIASGVRFFPGFSELFFDGGEVHERWLKFGIRLGVIGAVAGGIFRQSAAKARERAERGKPLNPSELFS